MIIKKTVASAYEYDDNKMAMEKIFTLVESLPHSDKFKLMQSLLSQLAAEERVSLQAQTEPTTDQGRRMAAILQRMADRRALSDFSDPVAWQREVRKDRFLPDRE
jgi:hypothetical protein